ncbi:MAG: thioesterase domain-containing protein [Mycobacterium sp.]
MTATFARWIKHFPGGGGAGATVLFPHAGGAAAAYRPLAKALSDRGVDTYIVQYPQRADRLAHPAAATVAELAGQLYEAGDWAQVGPLRLFGHCMGAVVAFEFACVAERHGVPVTQLWASAGQAPSTVAESPALPTSDQEVLADMLDLGGTDPRLLDDEDFVELLVRAVQADYRALDRYSCATDVRIAADIHAVAGERDHRVAREQMQRWETHTTGRFALSLFDGGHFYLTDHLDSVVQLVSADGR